MKKDIAFSGLEAAIVLIAFVVVAAVFSYVMLGAGFFATQKSQEVTYSGIKQATSNLIVDGTLYGTTGGSANSYALENVTFYLNIPQGGQPQKISYVEYTVTVDNAKIPYAGSTLGDRAVGKFVVVPTAADLVDGILLAGTSVKMDLYFGANAAEKLGPLPGGAFTMEVRPKVGASSLITKQLVTGYKGGPII